MTLTLRAEERQPNSVPKLIRLQSDGETFAEVRLLKASKVNVSGKNIQRNMATGITTVTDATVEIEAPGRKPVTVKADQIEVIYDDAGAARVAETRDREQKLAYLRQRLTDALDRYTDQHPVVKSLQVEIANLESRR